MVKFIVQLKDLKDALRYLEEEGGVQGGDFVQILQHGRKEIQVSEYSFKLNTVVNEGLFIPTYE